MINQITGLHHITSIAGDAVENNAFFTDVLGLRRIKKTVNFDAPDVYHLYYGDEKGSAGSVMTYFPFPNARQGTPGTGEVGTSVFAVPEGSIGFWKERLGAYGVRKMEERVSFGGKRLDFSGPDMDGFALVEVAQDARAPWTGNGVSADHAIRGFHSASMRLRDSGATNETLRFMGYEELAREGETTRFITKGDAATVIDVETLPEVEAAQEGAGSVHHVAFAVEDRASQLEVRKALVDAGHAVTPVIDRDYFYAIYFRAPGGVLFEVATHEPGFDRDEDIAHLGEALKLPSQYERLRPHLEKTLVPLEG